MSAETQSLIAEIREWTEGMYRYVCAPSPTRVATWLLKLAERVAALESREQVRYRIKPIQAGEKPEPGVGR